MRTLIERGGREFELPRGHTADLYHGRVTGRVTRVVLNCPGGGGSIFTTREIERRDDDIVVHLGEEVGRSGPAAFGDLVPMPMGYPFPDE